MWNKKSRSQIRWIWRNPQFLKTWIFFFASFWFFQKVDSQLNLYSQLKIFLMHRIFENGGKWKNCWNEILAKFEKLKKGSKTENFFLHFFEFRKKLIVSFFCILNQKKKICIEKMKMGVWWKTAEMKNVVNRISEFWNPHFQKLYA